MVILPFVPKNGWRMVMHIGKFGVRYIRVFLVCMEIPSTHLGGGMRVVI